MTTTGLSAAGPSGVLTVAGRAAAVLGRWSLRTTGEGEAWRLTAAVGDADPYWLAEGPFRLRLWIGGSGDRTWTWRGVPAEAVALVGQEIVITGEGGPEDA